MQASFHRDKQLYERHGFRHIAAHDVADEWYMQKEIVSTGNL